MAEKIYLKCSAKARETQFGEMLNIGVKVEDLKRTELLVYLAFNESAIAGVAKALKAETRIPGVRVYAEDSLAVRRK